MLCRLRESCRHSSHHQTHGQHACPHSLPSHMPGICEACASHLDTNKLLGVSRVVLYEEQG
ncbi:MAG TPA: hypothetical protein VI389_04910, partial [Geobacteraceae bacterium]